MIIDEKNRGGAAHLILAAVKSLQDLLKPSIFQSRPCSNVIRLLLNTCCPYLRYEEENGQKGTFCFPPAASTWGQGARLPRKPPVRGEYFVT